MPESTAKRSGRPVQRTRLAIVVTHPIQHFVPFYRALAADDAIDLHVFFGMPLGVKPYFDALMQTRIAWNMDMLDGYSSEFLEDVEEGAQSSFRKPNSSALAARLDAFAPDVVLVYGYAQLNCLRALFWCRRKHVPLLMISDSERAARNAPLREAVKRIVIPAIYRNIAGFLSVGDKNEDYYRFYGAPADRIFRSPFTIDEGAYTHAIARRADARADLRKALGLPGEAHVILYVGKLYPGKRPADAVDAMARLKAEARDEGVHLVIAGNGVQFDDLRGTAEKGGLNVHFLGFINVDRLPDIYAGADALVVPSENDRHPVVCSEAACMSLPFIISDRVGAVGPTDIARAGENALVYPCGDIAALAEAFSTIATDTALRHDMSARSRAIFETLNMESSVRGVLEAIGAVRGITP
jgi:glycosyltransferase involved in cell wall biosynthesis